MGKGSGGLALLAPGGADLDAPVGVLFADPGEEAPHLRRIAEPLQAVQLTLQAGIVEQHVDLAVTRRAQLRPRPMPAVALPGNQMMHGEVGDLPFAELAMHGRENRNEGAGSSWTDGRQASRCSNV